MTSVSLRAAPAERAVAAADRRVSGLVMAAGAVTLAAVLATASIAQARTMPESFADLAEQVAPAVVDISVVHEPGKATSGGEAAPQVPNMPQEGPFKDFFERFFDGEQGQPQMPSRPSGKTAAVGSGFIMDPEGYVVTNNHVVDGATEITVTTKDGTDYDAELIGRDAEDRSGPAQDRGRPRTLPLRSLRRLRRGSGRRLGDGRGQSLRPRRHGHCRHRLGPGPRPARRHADRLPADRRGDQPRQLRRPGVQRRRPGDRRQHRDLFAVWRQCRHRLRDSRPTRPWTSSPTCATTERSSAAGWACAFSR